MELFDNILFWSILVVHTRTLNSLLSVFFHFIIAQKVSEKVICTRSRYNNKVRRLSKKDSLQNIKMPSLIFEILCFLKVKVFAPPPSSLSSQSTIIVTPRTKKNSLRKMSESTVLNVLYLQMRHFDTRGHRSCDCLQDDFNHPEDINFPISIISIGFFGNWDVNVLSEFLLISKHFNK